MANGDSQKDWEMPMNFPVDDKKLKLDQLEKAVKAGFRIVRDGDKNTSSVVGRVIIKGNNNKDPLDVSINTVNMGKK